MGGLSARRTVALETKPERPPKRENGYQASNRSRGRFAKNRGTGGAKLRDFVRADRRFFERGLLALLREEAPFDPLKLISPPSEWGRTHSTYLLKQVRKRRGHILVAEVERARVGFIAGAPERPARGRNRSFDPSRHPCCIFSLYVAPKFRRRGIGNQLMGEMERRLRARGCDLVHMVAIAGNQRALDMYRTRGYDQRVLWLAKWLTRPT